MPHVPLSVVAAVAALTLASAAQANTEYDCGSFDRIALGVTYFDEEDVVGADVTQLSTGQRQSLAMRPAVSGNGTRYTEPSIGATVRAGRHPAGGVQQRLRGAPSG